MALEAQDQRPEFILARPEGQPDPRPNESYSWAARDVARGTVMLLLLFVSVPWPKVGFTGILLLALVTITPPAYRGVRRWWRIRQAEKRQRSALGETS